MNRRDFLKLLGLGAAVVATPKVFGWTRQFESGLLLAQPKGKHYQQNFGFQALEYYDNMSGKYIPIVAESWAPDCGPGLYTLQALEAAPSVRLPLSDRDVKVVSRKDWERIHETWSLGKSWES